MKDKRDREFLIKVVKKLTAVEKRVAVLENSKPVPQVPQPSPIQFDEVPVNRIEAVFRTPIGAAKEKIVIETLHKTLAKVCDDFQIYKLDIEIVRDSF